MQLEDGSEFGPISRTELDEWFREDRITQDCQLLKEGSSQWQWASDIYPSLAQTASPAAVLPPSPSANAPKTTATASNQVWHKDPFAAGVPLKPLEPSKALDSNQGSNFPAGAYSQQPLAPLPTAPAPSTSLWQVLREPAFDADGWVGNELAPPGKLGFMIICLSICFCCREMVPGWGIFGMSGFVGILIVTVTGLIGGALIGGRYPVPGAIAGAIGSIGAAIATILHLRAVVETETAALVVMGFLGAAPGFVLYFPLKIGQKLFFPPR